ncbi:MAG: hypothetical protein AVDCRST_MAG10-446 [uncultured Acidimicrobiales bacterium]|uniref:Uncharacterized protein n=1 Tax=uncultured Acidimicrobiales bacterium TaxID=310071 RepID=A0A6J4H861_9ACTN|nr:MAG: hypothetical protein AVDCRST_MAG10-446 [uncultured Acidimicrobiales bacterium]
MMTQEEYMNVKALKAAGWTITQIAKHLSYHPATFWGWLKAGGPPPKRSVPVEELVIDEYWRACIAALLAHNDELQATSIMRVIGAEGFDGSYQSLTRHLREVRGPRQRSASVVTVPIETAPGEEFQFDWSDCNHWARRWGLGTRASLLRRRAVLEPGQVLVVQLLHRALPHLRGPDPVLRGRRRRGGGGAHRPHGLPGSLPGQSVHLASAGAGVRPPLRLRPQGLRHRRRRSQWQDRAALPRPQGRLPARDGPRPARRHRRAEPTGGAVAGHLRPRRGPPQHRRRPRCPPALRDTAARPAAAAALRHRPP